MNARRPDPRLGPLGPDAYRAEVLTGLVGVAARSSGPSLARRGGRASRPRRRTVQRRWATPREVRQAGLYGRQGVVLGRLGGRLLV